MKPFSHRGLRAGCIAALSLARAWSSAGNLDVMGVTLLRQVDPALLGTGVEVAQAEAPISAGTPPPFEVNRANVGQPAALFTYESSLGTATTFPNSVGAESGHATGVDIEFYGIPGGVAPQVNLVDNYEAGFFHNSIISHGTPVIAAPVVNQSWIFSNLTPADQTAVEQNYDNYAARNNTLFVSGVGNIGSVNPPATCYNGVGVGAYGGSSSVGPTPDGRSKPDLTAPASETSFSTPYVAGAAAVLLQAANRGDGGPDSTAAGDLRTLKALLLNGALKPAGWTNGPSTPLDARYGAGVLNLFNSWRQMAGGQHPFIESTSSPTPPDASTNNEPALVGWDLNHITNATVHGQPVLQVNHYLTDSTMIRLGSLTPSSSNEALR